MPNMHAYYSIYDKYSTVGLMHVFETLLLQKHLKSERNLEDTMTFFHWIIAVKLIYCFLCVCVKDNVTVTNHKTCTTAKLTGWQFHWNVLVNAIWKKLWWMTLFSQKYEYVSFISLWVEENTLDNYNKKARSCYRGTKHCRIPGCDFEFSVLWKMSWRQSFH